MGVSSQYPPDEFDRAGEDMPLGMHRAKPSKWRAVIPFLVILIVVPLLGWAASQYLTSRGNSEQSGADTVVTVQQSAAQSGTESNDSVVVTQPSQGSQSGGETSATQAPTPSPSPTETSQEQEVDMNVKIGVLNGTGQNGYAAEKAAILNQAGFPGTEAANANGWLTEVSTVYYGDPALKASAQKIADTLGIERVAQDQDSVGTTTYDVVVVLK